MGEGLDYAQYQGDVDLVLVNAPSDEKSSSLELLTGDVDISDYHLMN